MRSLEIDGAALKYQSDGTTLRVPLPRPLPPNESVTLTLDFVVRVPELIDPQSFADANLASTGDALMVGYWYPCWLLTEQVEAGSKIIWTTSAIKARVTWTHCARLGAETFHAFLRDLYQRGACHLITTADFFKILIDHTHLGERVL